MRALAGLLTCLACAAVQADTPIATERGLKGFITVDQLPAPVDPVLAEGRRVWDDTCGNCHGGNKATGAPKITSIRAWESRIDQGMDVLIDHALNGFIGPKYTEMPARGANPDLTDAEVTAAVAFMVWTSGGQSVATEFINKTKGAGQ